MSDRDVINTAIAEAGSHPEGLRAVLYTILNRSVRDGQTPSQVVKAPGQYAGYSNPGSASIKAQNDPKVRAAAEKAWADVQARTVPDPTNGGYNFRSAAAAKGLSAPHGTVSIGGNTFAKGNSAPQTASAAIDALAPPNPQTRPSALAYAAPQPLTPTTNKVRAITINADGSGVPSFPKLPDAAMNGVQLPKGTMSPVFTPGQQYAPTPTTLGAHSLPPHDLLDASLLAPPGVSPRSVPSLPSVPSPALTSRSVHTVPIDPLTGNPTVASVPSSRIERSAPAIAAPKVSISDGFGTQTDFNKGNQDALLGAAKNIPGIGPIISGGQAAASLLTPQPQRANVPAPTVYAPQKPTAAQMASINYVPPVSQTGRPTAAQLAAINDVSGVAPTSHTAVPTGRIPPTTALAFNGDQNTGITAPGLTAINGQIAQPTVAPVPRPRPIVPSIPIAPIPPKVSFPSQVAATVTNAFNHSPVGHVAQYISGKPVTGGLLAMLQGSPIQAARLVTGGVASAPSVIAPNPDWNAVRYQQAQNDLRNSGMIDSFGMLTGSGGHGDAAH